VIGIQLGKIYLTNNSYATMKSTLQSLKIPAIILGVVLAAMAITNPDKEVYLNHSSVTMANEVKENLCSNNSQGGLESILANVCKNTIDQQQGAIRVYLNNFSERQNFGLFSVYTTKIPQRTYTSIGAFGNFLTFSQDK
jgi:Domain of unknown function (DUF4359)